MRHGLAVAAFLLAACQSPEPGLSALWSRWFSFRAIHQITASPDGERILISSGDTRDTAAPSGVSQRLFWTTVLRPDGSVIDEWTPAERRSVSRAQIDDDGWIFGVAQAATDPADIDAFPYPSTTCVIVALDPAGAIAWELPWPSDDGSCPQSLLLADGMLVVRDGVELTGISRDGTVQWRREMPHRGHSGVVHDDAVWFVAAPDLGPSPQSRHENIVMRCEPATGEIREVQLEDPLPHVRALEVTADGFVIRRSEHGIPYGAWHTAAFDRAGKLRWTSKQGAGDITDPIVALLATRGGLWQFATDTPPPNYDDPPDVTEPIIHRQWIVAEHLDGEGHIDATVRRSFAEDPEDAVDIDECPNDGTVPRTVDGSRVTAVIHLGEDAVLVAGVQGCRDAFVLALEASR